MTSVTTMYCDKCGSGGKVQNSVSINAGVWHHKDDKYAKSDYLELCSTCVTSFYTWLKHRENV